MVKGSLTSVFATQVRERPSSNLKCEGEECAWAQMLALRKLYLSPIFWPTQLSVELYVAERYLEYTEGNDLTWHGPPPLSWSEWQSAAILALFGGEASSSEPSVKQNLV